MATYTIALKKLTPIKQNLALGVPVHAQRQVFCEESSYSVEMRLPYDSAGMPNTMHKEVTLTK